MAAFGPKFDTCLYTSGSNLIACSFHFLTAFRRTSLDGSLEDLHSHGALPALAAAQAGRTSPAASEDEEDVLAAP